MPVATKGKQVASGALEVSGDIVAAATTLAGLVLVFLGSTSTSYESYGAAFKTKAVRQRFQIRAWFAFIGFALSLFAALFAILAKWHGRESNAEAALILFLVALIWVLLAALWSVLDIK